MCNSYKIPIKRVDILHKTDNCTQNNALFDLQ